LTKSPRTEETRRLNTIIEEDYSLNLAKREPCGDETNTAHSASEHEQGTETGGRNECRDTSLRVAGAEDVVRTGKRRVFQGPETSKPRHQAQAYTAVNAIEHEKMKDEGWRVS